VAGASPGPPRRQFFLDRQRSAIEHRHWPAGPASPRTDHAPRGPRRGKGGWFAPGAGKLVSFAVGQQGRCSDSWLEGNRVMGSKFDKLVKDRIAKTGEKWAMAVRNVRLQEQRPNFPMVVGQVPAVGYGADPVAASKRAQELASNPLYFAGTGGEEHLITRDEHDRLIRQGALDERNGQMIRAPRSVGHFEGLTFSAQCEECLRWIWCGNEQRESACVCGNAYRVVFDLIDHFAWEMRDYPCCADCGTKCEVQRVTGAVDEWGYLNRWQPQCWNCRAQHTIVTAIVARHLPYADVRRRHGRWRLENNDSSREDLRAASFGELLTQIVAHEWADAGELNEMFTVLCREARIEPF